MKSKPAPHTKTFYLCRPAPGRAYTLQSQPVPGAECIPVMGAKPAREMQKELNASLPRKRNGWKPGERPAGSGRKKLEIPTKPVTLRISEDVLALYPEDVYERNREMVAAIVNAKKPSFSQILREEFLINTQNFPKEYLRLFEEKFKRAENSFADILNAKKTEK